MILKVKSRQKNIIKEVQQNEKIYASHPGWCGSVNQVPACELKSHWLDSQSGHCLGCGPGPCLGALERHSVSLSLSPSLPSPLSRNKKIILRIYSMSLERKWVIIRYIFWQYSVLMNAQVWSLSHFCGLTFLGVTWPHTLKLLQNHTLSTWNQLFRKVC